ncbi:MAG: hypothetical protein M3Q31_20835, partial [Actinomycetota bacterium]|nr:hypothetical protein [Actinomycetota bacterium]
MRSLVAQLVALALAVPVSTVSSTHAQTRTPVAHSRAVVAPVHHARGGCAAYCQVRTLRREL